jgi:uncharacterized membrane protein YdjX (TVP38/TMEM64 family)
LFICGYIILSQIGLFLQDPSIKELIQAAGVWGVVIFSVIYLATIVIAPIPGFPLLIMGFGLFGVPETVGLNYLLTLVGGAINFYVARVWGRGVIQDLVGKKGLERVDKNVDRFSTEALILTRLFDGILNDWISYAAGLTSISLGKFLLISALCTIPYNLVSYFFAQNTRDLGQLFVSLTIIYYVIFSLPFLYFLVKKLLWQR